MQHCLARVYHTPCTIGKNAPNCRLAMMMIADSKSTYMSWLFFKKWKRCKWTMKFFIHCGNIYSQRVMVGIPYFSRFFVTLNHLWRFSEITKRVNKTGHYVPCKVTLTISWINACKTRSVRNVIRCIFLWHKTARAPLMVLENYCEFNRSRWVRCSTLLL